LGDFGGVNVGTRYGPIFQYGSGDDFSRSGWAYDTQDRVLVNTSNAPGANFTYVAATASSAGVPEIDGALAPKVGFLLACLFLIFGRKKENTEPMLTV
jgi:hypothetical protein